MTSCAAELVDLALRDDSSAVDHLVERLGPIITRSVRRVLSGRRRGFAGQDARDFEQDVWLALLKRGGRQLKAFDPARASLEAYVHLIARREVSNRLRATLRLRASEVWEEPATSADPEARCVDREQVAALVEHLEAQLPERGRAVFLEIFGAHRSPPEVSTHLGVETQVVYNWQHRIRMLARAYRRQLEA